MISVAINLYDLCRAVVKFAYGGRVCVAKEREDEFYELAKELGMIDNGHGRGTETGRGIKRTYSARIEEEGDLDDGERRMRAAKYVKTEITVDHEAFRVNDDDYDEVKSAGNSHEITLDSDDEGLESTFEGGQVQGRPRFKFSCSKCPDKVFYSERSVKEHVNEVHNSDSEFRNDRREEDEEEEEVGYYPSSVEKGKFNCSKCPSSKSFSSERTVKEHVQNAHNGEYVDCPQCNKTFPSIGYLKKHVRGVHHLKGLLLEDFLRGHCDSVQQEVNEIPDRTPVQVPLVAEENIENEEEEDDDDDHAGNNRNASEFGSGLNSNTNGDTSGPVNNSYNGFNKESQIYEYENVAYFQSKSFPGKVECSKCPGKLYAKKSIKTHIKNVHKAGPAKCPLCEKVSKNINCLKDHARRSHNVKTSGLRQLLAAQNPDTHNNDDILDTDDEGDVYIRADQRDTEVEAGEKAPGEVKNGNANRDQVAQDTNANVNQCDEDKADDGDEIVAWFEVEEGKFGCSKCQGKFYCTEELVKNHIQRKHQSKAFSCPHCGRAYKRKNSMRYHMKGCPKREVMTEHEETEDEIEHESKAEWFQAEDGTFRCLKCDGRQYASESSVKDHIRSHSRGPFNCPQCGKEYQSKTGLRYHKKRCNIPTTETEPAVITENEDINTEDESEGDEAEFRSSKPDGKIVNPINCPHCRKGYKSTKSLREHMKRCRFADHDADDEVMTENDDIDTEDEGRSKAECFQTEEGKFGCSRCDGKLYPTESSAKSHIRNVHEGIQTDCPECGKTYPSARNMKDHFRKVHKISRKVKEDPNNYEAVETEDENEEVDNINVDVTCLENSVQSGKWECSAESCKGTVFSSKEMAVEHVLRVHKGDQTKC